MPLSNHQWRHSTESRLDGGGLRDHVLCFALLRGRLQVQGSVESLSTGLQLRTDAGQVVLEQPLVPVLADRDATVDDQRPQAVVSTERVTRCSVAAQL